jgi:hypothetical protein
VVFFAVTVALAACGDLGSTTVGAALSPCASAQRDAIYLRTARLVATFELTAAELAAWDESPAMGSHAGPGMSPARSLDPAARLFACYFDGDITFSGPLPPGASPPIAERALLIVGAQGGVVETRGGTIVGLPLGRPTAATPWPTVGARVRPPILVDASWRTTPITSAEIAALLTASGVPSRILPHPAARMLLYGAVDVDPLAIDDPAVVGAAIYRYPTVAAARGALRLDVVQDPARGTVEFITTPYFVAIGNTLVSFAASDSNAAVRIIAILQEPRP